MESVNTHVETLKTSNRSYDVARGRMDHLVRCDIHGGGVGVFSWMVGVSKLFEAAGTACNDSKTISP